MSTHQSYEALRRANPRAKAGFAASVEAAGAAVRAAVETEPRGASEPPSPGRAGSRCVACRRRRRGVRRDRLVERRSRAESAVAAFREAATVTAASAERSGTAVVRITHDGEEWAGSTIRWHGDDVSITRAAQWPWEGRRRDARRRRRPVRPRPPWRLARDGQPAEHRSGQRHHSGRVPRRGAGGPRRRDPAEVHGGRDHPDVQTLAPTAPASTGAAFRPASSPERRASRRVSRSAYSPLATSPTAKPRTGRAARRLR